MKVPYDYYNQITFLNIIRFWISYVLVWEIHFTFCHICHYHCESWYNHVLFLLFSLLPGGGGDSVEQESVCVRPATFLSHRSFHNYHNIQHIREMEAASIVHSCTFPSLSMLDTSQFLPFSLMPNLKQVFVKCWLRSLAWPEWSQWSLSYSFILLIIHGWEENMRVCNLQISFFQHKT